MKKIGTIGGIGAILGLISSVFYFMASVNVVIITEKNQKIVSIFDAMMVISYLLLIIFFFGMNRYQK